MTDPILIDLPLGPSVNNMYPTIRGRRMKSRGYKAWLDAAGWELKAQKPGRVEGPYRLVLRLPMELPSDISNHLKAVEDLLVTHRITPDDRHAHASGAERCADVPAGRCHVEVRAA